MGKILKTEGNRAIVQGGKKLEGSSVIATDLRAGAALALQVLLCLNYQFHRFGHVERGIRGARRELRCARRNILRIED